MDNKIDLDAIMRDFFDYSKSSAKECMKEAIRQALVLASENAHAYLDYDCETEDGYPSAIIDRDSIMEIEKRII